MPACDLYTAIGIRYKLGTNSANLVDFLSHTFTIKVRYPKSVILVTKRK